MERIFACDLEGDGLLDEITTIHCGCFKNISTGECFDFLPDQIPDMLDWIQKETDVLVIHNGIGFDIPALQKLYGFTYKGRVIDTLVLSRLLDPKRIIPPHMENKKAGPHSIEAWGYRVGRGKPEHNDWSKFTPEMLHRCKEDVEILCLVYNKLLEEQKGGDWKRATQLSLKLFEALHKQEQYGWLVDRKHMEFCIHQLQHWVTRIDKALAKSLPLVVEVQEQKIKGEYQHIKKPFLKSGKYSQPILTWLSTLEHDVSVGGPFTRLSFRRLDLNSNQETKDFLLDSG